jgi:hypothetical protein
MLLALSGFNRGKLFALLACVGGERQLVAAGRFRSRSRILAAGAADRFEIVQIASQLIGVVAVEKQAQRVRIAAQVLSIEELLQLASVALSVPVRGPAIACRVP